MDAFDADVLIYAGVPGHPLGRRVAALFRTEPVGETVPRAGVGSVLLLPEVLSKPLKEEDASAVTALSDLLIRLELRPVDQAIAVRAAVLGAKYKLRVPEATHLATAISMGAHRFITNNSRDFDGSITEIEVTYPADLPDPVG
jgi:predicted nucleic acid-binding protein